MVGAAGLGRMVLKKIGKSVLAEGLSQAEKTSRAITAGAVGEGLVTAGQNTEQLRQDIESGTLTPAQVAIMAGSGAITGIISRMSGGLSKRLGITDINTLLQGVDTGAKRKGAFAVLRGLMESALTEGAFEELPQSAQNRWRRILPLANQQWMAWQKPEQSIAGGSGMGMMGAGAGAIKRRGGTEPSTYEGIVKKLQDAVYLNETIDNGLKTGMYGEDILLPITPLKLSRKRRTKAFLTTATLTDLKTNTRS